MKHTKRVISAILAGVCALSLAACGSSDSSSTSPSSDNSSSSDSEQLGLTTGGKTFRIYCWNDEIQNRFKYVEDLIPDDVKVEWVQNDNENNVYQTKLDEALEKQADADPDDRIDMFLFEADYALKYVNSDYTVDVKDVGITDDDMSEMYQYTLDVATDSDGCVKALTWQATPGLYAYRRDIAKEVLGTDDPDEVQEMLSDWDKFDEVAAKMKEAGYYMLSGYDDSYRVFSNNVTNKWVNDDNEIIVDDAIKEWVEQTKTYTDNGYNNKTILWDDTWNADQGPNGKVFGFFYSTWGINFTLAENSLADAKGEEAVGNGLYGEYAVCEGPASYYWGGSWIAAADGSDNKDELCAVMKALTCDEDIAKQITIDTQDYTNNKAAMESIANDDTYGSAFLGGQNHIKLFVAAAPNIDASNMTAYDQGCNEQFQTAMHDYFAGNVTLEEAYDNFYKAVIKLYPELKEPSE